MRDATSSVAKENFSTPRASQSGATNAPAPFAFLALIIGNAALATGPLFVRLADVGPVASGFWRLALALPILLALAFWEHRRRLAGGSIRAGRSVLWLAAAAGVFFAADLASWHIGILQTKMANATLFGNSASLIMAATTLLLARRWPVKAETLALTFAVVGAVLLLRESGQQGTARLRGDLLCLLAGVLYTGYMLTMQRARGALGSWAALGLSTAAGVLPLLLFAMVLGEAIWPGDWRPVVLLALTSQLVGQGLLIYALPHFSALVVGLTLLTQPAVSALIGWMFRGETLTTTELIGGVLVAAALVLIRLPLASRNAAS